MCRVIHHLLTKTTDAPWLIDEGPTSVWGVLDELIDYLKTQLVRVDSGQLQADF